MAAKTQCRSGKEIAEEKDEDEWKPVPLDLEDAFESTSDVSSTGRGRCRLRKPLTEVVLPRSLFGDPTIGPVENEPGKTTRQGRGRGQTWRQRAAMNYQPARIPGQKSFISKQDPTPSESKLLTAASTKQDPTPAESKLLASTSSKQRNNPISASKTERVLQESNSREINTRETSSSQAIKDEQGTSDYSVIINNIPPSVSEKEMRDLVETFGGVVSSKVSQKSSDYRFAQIFMKDKSVCEWVISCLDGTFLPGSDISLECHYDGLDS